MGSLPQFFSNVLLESNIILAVRADFVLLIYTSTRIVTPFPLQEDRMTFDKNPFPAGDADRHALWEMLVRRDIDAFLAQDWGSVEDDFIAESFFGMHAHFLNDADAWRLQFPRLEIYRDEWLRQAAETAKTAFAEPLREALFRVTNMRDIDVDGDRAVLHKKFNGQVAKADGTFDKLNWQTLYFCRRVGPRWKIAGFVGYMPHPLGR
jgi:hypothetical protein